MNLLYRVTTEKGRQKIERKFPPFRVRGGGVIQACVRNNNQPETGTTPGRTRTLGVSAT